MKTIGKIYYDDVTAEFNNGITQIPSIYKIQIYARTKYVRTNRPMDYHLGSST